MRIIKILSFTSVFALLALILTGCGNETSSDQATEKQGGIIVKNVHNETANKNKQILLIPDINKEDIMDKTFEELVELAQEKQGAYYGVTDDEYDGFNEGDHVVIYWNGAQLDSDPPQRGADKIEVITTSR